MVASTGSAVHVDRARVFALFHNEVAVNRDVWEKRRLLDSMDEGDDESFLEELVRDRANQSLAHVFTLLALVLRTDPLRLAFSGPADRRSAVAGHRPEGTRRASCATFAIGCGGSSTIRTRPERRGGPASRRSWTCSTRTNRFG